MVIELRMSLEILLGDIHPKFHGFLKDGLGMLTSWRGAVLGAIGSLCYVGFYSLPFDFLFNKENQKTCLLSCYVEIEDVVSHWEADRLAAFEPRWFIGNCFCGVYTLRGVASSFIMFFMTETGLTWRVVSLAILVMCFWGMVHEMGDLFAVLGHNSFILEPGCIRGCYGGGYTLVRIVR
ncbi:hypothetical protein SLEP1_g56014 [Rubroshorea leprosula]|uniref:Uncharacterized protein n=1 Tax=Rubroshorea leprosula TaxID=152421 RepID=A0AAV5MH47_9ROSI|nr:hypothetical protein SLEP1_g56014 [Rubroshorea leprosula]